MRKIFSFLVAAVFVACAASSVFALGVDNSTLTAKVTFTGAGTFSWDATVLNVNDHTAHTDPITWSNAQAQGTWTNADQYVLITSTMTGLTGTIRVYTRNKEGSEFQLVTASSQNLGGLIGVEDANKILPMGWRMANLAEVDLETVKNIPTIPDLEGEGVPGAYASSYFLDKANWNFDLISGTPGTETYVNNKDYSSVLTTAGVKFGSGPDDRGGAGSGRFAMFLSAEFSGALTSESGSTYGCDTLTLQGINE